MNKRKRVPIQLKGSDEQYFRTREIQTRPVPVDPELAAETAPEPVVQEAPKVAPERAKKPTQAEGQGAAKKTTRSVPPEEPAALETEEGEVVSRIVPLGWPLSRRLQDVAEQTGVPVDDLLYAARKKAVARVRARIAATDKPEIPKVEKGGEKIRISFKLTAEELARLKAWFDPLDLGLGIKAVAPLLAEALKAEVEDICAAAF